MKVGIDGRGAVLYRGTGIGTYTWQLIRELRRLQPDLLTLWPGAEYRDFSLEKETDWGTFLEEYLREEKVDIYHVPQNGLGLPAKTDCKLVVTIHDLIPYLFPETVGRGYLREFLTAMPEVLSRSHHIIAVSRCTKRDLMKLFGLPSEKITVIYEAPEPVYRPLPEEAVKGRLKEKYAIEGPYLLYVGGFGMRKNVKGLLTAYALLCRETPLREKLVLPGKRNHEFDQLETVSSALGIGDRVIFPGYVPVEDLPFFYGGARLVIYPSFYEGFGLPPLEAMACGRPVLAANTSSLPEILGDGVCYFNPYHAYELAEKMAELLCDREGLDRLGEKGRHKAASYSWHDAARETLAVYSSLFRE